MRCFASNSDFIHVQSFPSLNYNLSRSRGEALKVRLIMKSSIFIFLRRRLFLLHRHFVSIEATMVQRWRLHFPFKLDSPSRIATHIMHVKRKQKMRNSKCIGLLLNVCLRILIYKPRCCEILWAILRDVGATIPIIFRRSLRRRTFGGIYLSWW